MPDLDSTPWTALPIVPYGAVLHVPGGWEALPPVPANGPEVLRATGGPRENLIVFKVPTRGRSAVQVADTAQERLAAHGYDDFVRTQVTFAGRPGVALDFVTVRDADGAVVYRTREYFAVRGHAAFILGMGSATWEQHLPLIEAIAERFELTD
ncbi:MAG: hypothetical protein BGO37_13465 [Cellulomonas sp. 73-92]|uniref:hypothetical protein n=1 Tax=Cellulomonas sp. 73-92 TaxID=1895740 RepID=UPI00092693E9|nr:hypothetical protein [Cellulomonas sp. 73-92]OJV82969.1 MAG: hypothetical protein BGO37_13465 [Cellulomonas sp. 73-92]